MKNILITGAKGQLGQEINKLVTEKYNSYKATFFFTDVEDLDITNGNALRTYIRDNKINLVVNCAAYTAVDKAESDPEKAEKINAIAPSYLAAICREFDSTLIHISTDFIFDGKKATPYIETDTPNPISIYGKTKLDGERGIINRASTFVIIRTSWLYSEFGMNFVKTMIKLGKERKELKVVFDQVGTPTYARDLARVILDIIPKIQKGTKEIFNYSNEGVASWYDFALSAIKMKNLDCKVLPIETRDYPTPAKRPSYSVMNKAKIKAYFDVEIPYWQESLGECIKRI